MAPACMYMTKDLKERMQDKTRYENDTSKPH